MNCPSCGAASERALKYCNRCGAQLSDARETSALELFEKRMDSEMEGLFWITVLGIALILGGMFLLKQAQLGEWLIAAFMLLSSAAFITYFALGVWQVRRLARSSKEASGGALPLAQRETHELTPPTPHALPDSTPSITEHTTRTLEPVPAKRVR